MITAEKKTSQTKTLSIVACVVLLGLAAYVIKMYFVSGFSSGSLAYYTIDDGATTFTDRLDLIPPFEHKGKQAVRAWVFTTDEGKTSTVGYLERYTPESKARFESQLADFNAGKTKQKPSINPGDTEVKRPNSNGPWVNTSDRGAANQVTHFTSPGAVTPDLLLP